MLPVPHADPSHSIHHARALRRTRFERKQFRIWVVLIANDFAVLIASAVGFAEVLGRAAAIKLAHNRGLIHDTVGSPGAVIFAPNAPSGLK